MIQAKPQTSTIISFSLFTIITMAVLVMNIFVLINTPHPAWYTYAITSLLGGIGAFVVYKIFIQYKIIKMGNNEIVVHYPVLRRTQRHSLSQIAHWSESQVKTGKNSIYKELVIQFEDGKKISTAQKEYTEYKKMIQYLIMKAGKKRKTAS